MKNIWRGVCVSMCLPPEGKLVSLLKNYSKKIGTAGKGDNEAYLTAGCEVPMR